MDYSSLFGTTNCTTPLNMIQHDEYCNSLSCDKQNSDFKCSLIVSGLKFNREYTFSMSVISSNGKFEWPSTESNSSILTSQSAPNGLETIEVKIEEQLQSSFPFALSIVRPGLDELNGAIKEGYLFLVHLGSSEQLINKTIPRFTYSNPFYLISNHSLCSNQTPTSSPCLLNKYEPSDTDLTIDQLILIGKFEPSNPLLTNLTYENITTSLIRSKNVYQVLYLFRVGNLYLNVGASPLITTRSIMATPASLSRDGMSMWLVVVLSIVATFLFLMIIIGLVALLLFRYKPSKFHKAAHMVAQPRLTNSLTKSKPHKIDDYSLNICYSFTPPGEFSCSQMTNIWLVKHANSDAIFEEEYRNLPDFRSLKTSHASNSLRNESKNRFLDIKAYDEFRVVLKTDWSERSRLSVSTASSNDEFDEPSDYINANFVQGYSHEKKFIATQGPKKETIVDFWRMIHQYKVSAIVMLTKLVERGVERCTQYWPDKIGITELYGELEVTMKEQ